MTLLTRIKDLAQKQLLSISEIEKSASLGNGTIRRWDTSPPACDKLLRVANTLNVSVDYLLTGENNQCFIELSDNERELLTEYKKLDFRGRSAAMSVIVAEQERMASEKNTNRNTKIG